MEAVAAKEKSNYLLVSAANIRWMRLCVCLDYIPKMRVGDTLHVRDRGKLAQDVRYWRNYIRKHPGERVVVKLPPSRKDLTDHA